MGVLKFKYIPIPELDKSGNKIAEIYRPLIPIRLSYNRKPLHFTVNSLLDSGADMNLFPADWGIAAGINIKKGAKKNIFGIGGVQIEGYVHRVTLYVGTKCIPNAEATFTFEQRDPLLGRQGFFNYFRSVSFHESTKSIELES